MATKPSIAPSGSKKARSGTWTKFSRNSDLSMSRLIISSPDGKKGILELNKPVITIGRGNANDLVLNDSSVSRFHAVVKLRDNAVVIADRGSTNGVVLGGKKIAQETEMQHGDIAVLGLYELRLEHVDETRR